MGVGRPRGEPPDARAKLHQVDGRLRQRVRRSPERRHAGTPLDRSAPRCCDSSAPAGAAVPTHLTPSSRGVLFARPAGRSGSRRAPADDGRRRSGWSTRRVGRRRRAGGVDPGAGRGAAGARAVRGQAGHRRAGPDGRADARLPARPRPLPARGRARGGQDARGGDARRGRRRHLRPAAVHPGPGPVRHRRHPDLQARLGALRHRARPRVRQLRAHRRDQPGAGEGAVRAARGHVAGAGVDRRHDVPDAPAVPGAGHPEPDRVRGRLPAAGGAARPVPDEGRGRLPDRRGGAGDRLPDGRRSRRRPTRCSARRTCCGCSGRPATSSCTTRWSTTWSGWCCPPGSRASTAWPTSPAGSRTGRARAPRWA